MAERIASAMVAAAGGRWQIVLGRHGRFYPGQPKQKFGEGPLTRYMDHPPEALFDGTQRRF